MPGLTHLDLSYTAVEGLGPIFDTCSALRSLCLGSCRQLAPDALDRLLLPPGGEEQVGGWREGGWMDGKRVSEVVGLRWWWGFRRGLAVWGRTCGCKMLQIEGSVGI